MIRTKEQVLISGTLEGWYWKVYIKVTEKEKIYKVGAFGFRNEHEEYKKQKERIKMRASDRVWVYRNIPSSIHWYTEIHHDWEDGARMYLLTKAEHILRHRK